MSAKIIITEVKEQPKGNRWSYPLTEIPYLMEQIEDCDRENRYEFLLYDGRLYETETTEIGLNNETPIKYANTEIDFTIERLVEIASQAIDGLIQDDRWSAMEYFRETMELSEYEMDFFGVTGNDEHGEYYDTEYDDDFDDYDRDYEEEY